jgi:hypothetical protein
MDPLPPSADAPSASHARDIIVKAAAAIVALTFFITVARWFRPNSTAARQPGEAPTSTFPRTGTPRTLEPRTLGELIGRRYLVRIHAGPDGPLYTVCDRNGKVLQADLHADDVYRSFPDLDIPSLQAGPDDHSVGLTEPGGP